MIQSGNLVNIFCENFLVILLWHLFVFVACKSLNNEIFDYKRYMYKTKYWEENGGFYNKRLKIKLWKDFLPQYISKNGFSKKTLDSLSLEYIDRFILETCRGEWAHKKCMLVSVLLLFINRFLIGFVFGSLVVFFNMPFICIQRYNRIRLLRVREKLLQQTEGQGERLISFAKRLNIADSQ